ncbi:MAG: DUF2723 domain-containing protein [Thermoanaerobaculia bacterium]
MDRQRPGASTALAFFLPLALYLATLAPTIYNLDSAELTTAAATGGLMRATGYPLYLLLGRFWSRLPFGDVGYRMNLFSAVCAAGTVAMADVLLRRLGAGAAARLGALGLLATSHYFWALAVIAEVYTLHTLMLTFVLWTLLHWAERPTPARLGLATLTVALSFGNHVATVLLVPGCLWLVLRTDRRRALAPRALAWAAGGLLLGFALYLYLPWLYLHDPAFNYAGRFDGTGRFHAIDLTTWSGLWWLVSGKAFSSVMLAYTPRELVGEIGHFVVELWHAFFVVGLGPGLVGAVLLWRRRRPLGEALTLMFVVTAGFYVNYRVIDKDTMFLPAWVLWALWVGVGSQGLLDWLRSHPMEGGILAGERPAKALVGLLVAAVVGSLVWTGPLVDRSDDASAYVRGSTILGMIEEKSLIVGWWDTVPVIQYLQLIEGERPDVTALNRFMIDAPSLQRLVLRRLRDQPVYFDAPPDDLFPQLQAEPVGPVYRMRLRRETPPELPGGVSRAEAGAL